VRHLLDHRRLHDAGKDQPDVHRRVAQLDPERLGEPDERELRGAVAAEGRDAATPGERGDVDDRPVALGAHQRDDLLHHEERAEEVHAQHALQVGGVDVRDGARQEDAGVVHDDVEAAELGDDPADARGDLRTLRDVGRQDERRAAGLARDRLELRSSTRGERDAGAGGGERDRRGATDTARGAGDEHRLPTKRRVPRHVGRYARAPRSTPTGQLTPVPPIPQ
jgi:hypothetical protein